MEPEVADFIPSKGHSLPMAAQAEKTEIFSSDESTAQDTVEIGDVEHWKPDRRLWAVVGSLTFLNVVGGLENTITVVALPFIVADIDGGSDFVW